MDFLKKNYKKLSDILKAVQLPEHDEIFELTDNVSTILEKENKSYRPYNSDNQPGGLVDFSNSKLPVVVIPDLHARPKFLINILDYKINGNLTVFEALSKKKINVVCVGDILHTEKNTKERWIAAQTEFDNGIYTGPSMSAEMQEGLALLCGVLKLKQMFPEHFHWLKGNHENILNRTADGDFSFRKYADEGHMVKSFLQEYYGDDIVYMIHCVENALPLMFVGKNCVISHAEPKTAFTKQQVIDARLDKNIVEGLTWTDNDEAEFGSVEQTIKNVCNVEDVSEYVYLGGHRPVNKSYELRQNGLYIQIHNPAMQNIAYIKSKSKFNPNSDIIEVKK